jgi:hypothetical protein
MRAFVHRQGADDRTVSVLPPARDAAFGNVTEPPEAINTRVCVVTVIDPDTFNVEVVGSYNRWSSSPIPVSAPWSVTPGWPTWVYRSSNADDTVTDDV